MTSPLRLCVRRSPAPDAEGAATLVTLRLPSDIACVEEAVELSYFGAKVIHPGAAKHAVALGVPLRIRNTFHPEDPGTLILADRRGVAEIAAVACKRGTSLIKVRSLPSGSPVGSAPREPRTH